MTPHLIPHYGPHSLGLIIARRPLAYPGLYAPGAGVTPSPCDWFTPAADTPFKTAAADVDWASDATGGWRSRDADQDWHGDATGGWRRKKPCG